MPAKLIVVVQQLAKERVVVVLLLQQMLVYIYLMIGILLAQLKLELLSKMVVLIFMTYILKHPQLL